MACSITWTPILEMDDDNGNHTCYAAVSEKSRYGNRYIWLTQFPDGWHVERSIAFVGDPYNGIETVTICKTLASAKGYAARYLFRR